MKKRFKSSLFGLLALFAVVLLTSSCDRVQPNYWGVLMENFGKNGKKDYTRVQGRVGTMAATPTAPVQEAELSVKYSCPTQGP